MTRANIRDDWIRRPGGYDRIAEATRKAAHAHDTTLRKNGVLMGIADVSVPMRSTNAARVETMDGHFMGSSLLVAGFAIIEAADLAEAIGIASQTPCAVVHGVVEVWPSAAGIVT